MRKESDLHNYQWTSHDHIIEHLFCALFMDMGLGKTVATLTAIKTLMFELINISSVLVVAPKRVVETVWTAEIDNWEHLKGITTSRIIGNERERKAAIAKRADIHLISRDNIAWLCGQYGGSMLPWDMLIIDESSSFKNPKSQRFKALRGVQPSFDRIVLLTGTPVPNGLIDLWPQIYLLDRGARLGKFISNYRSNYFSPGQRNGAIVYNYRIQSDGEQRIYDKIGDICISMKKEDYLELPGVVHNYIDIVFPAALQEKYNDFEESQVLQLFEEQDDDKDISAINAAALSNKLLQFANGAVYDENKNWHVVHDLKLDALHEIIEDANGKPVLVAYTYKHDRDRIFERLKKYKPVQLKTGQHINDWNAGKILVMIMHPASGGHGLNLQAGGNIITWFGETWNAELYDQFNARIDRQGKTEVTIINHLVAVNTIETRVVKVVKNKLDKQDGLMEAVKAIADRVKKYLK
jgi:SNF2 family DNA or RNA helicase